jgi:hypothetical protein
MSAVDWHQAERVKADRDLGLARRTHESHLPTLRAQLDAQRDEIAALKDTLAVLRREHLAKEQQALVAPVRAAALAAAPAEKSKHQTSGGTREVKESRLLRDLEAERRRSADLQLAVDAATAHRAQLQAQLKESTAQLSASEQQRRALREVLFGQRSKALAGTAAGMRSQLVELRRAMLAVVEEMRTSFSGMAAAVSHLQHMQHLERATPAHRPSSMQAASSVDPDIVRSVEQRVIQQVYFRIVSSGLTHRHALLILGLPLESRHDGRPSHPRPEIQGLSGRAVGGRPRPATAFSR